MVREKSRLDFRVMESNSELHALKLTNESIEARLAEVSDEVNKLQKAKEQYQMPVAREC